MRKRLKKISLTIITMIMVFMLTAPNVLAVGIYVDEGANPIPEETTEQQTDIDQPAEPPNEQTGDQTQVPAEESGEVKQTDEQTAEPPKAESIKEPVKRSEMEGQSNPFMREMAGLTSGDVMISEMMLANESRAGGSGTPGVLDVGVSSISINKDGYHYNGTDVSGFTGPYNISGTTGVNSIYVSDGNITININDLGMDLSTQEKLPAIWIGAGATVNLVLSNTPNNASSLTGGKYASAIQVDRGGTLNISGSGTLYAVGGVGAAGIGGDLTTPTGGRLVFGSQNAHVIAYSDNTGGAINMYSVSATMAKLAHGIMNATAVDPGAEQTVVLENRNSPAESYTLRIPAGYCSFAVTTTAAGGEYISYKDGQQSSGNLLATASGGHVYNLLNANEISVLTGLTSQPIKYKVTFHANSGRFVSSGLETIYTEVLYGSTVGEPEEPFKNSNNTVEGWYRNIEGTSAKWDFGSDAIVKDTTLYVKWKPNQCTVTFAPGYQGGPSGSKVYTNGDKILKTDLPAVDNPGKILGGWYTNTTPSVNWDFANDVVTKESFTLTAVWLNEYTVKFNKNTTDTVNDLPADTKVTEGMTLPTLNDPSRVNWEFTGWYKDTNGTQKWDASNDKVTSNITLYAGWAVKNCTVKFVTGTGGSSVADASVGYKIPITEPTNVTMQPRVGEKPTTYSIEGWYTDAAFKNRWDFQTPLVSKTAEITLHAKWHQDTCYVTYDGDGGTTDAGDGTVVKDYNYKDPAAAPVFKKEGYDLTQWNKGNVKYDLATPLTEDISLKAVWQIKSYELKFDAKGGTPTPALQKIQYNKTATKVVNPKRPGYVFEGWYTKDTYEADSKWDFTTSKMPAKDVTLYAKWLPIKYTVIFDADGGIPAPSSEADLEYDSKVQVPADMTKDHYDFGGWYAKPDFTGNKWDFDTNVIGDASGVLVEDEESLTGSLTLHARWIPEKYKVTFESNGVGSEPGPDIPAEEKEQEVEYNTATRRPNYPAEEWKGHTLIGWYTDPDFAEDSRWSFSDEEIPTLIDQDVKLYAQWKCNEYKTYYVTEDEDPVWSGDIYHYDDLVKKPEDPPKKENYDFDGWYTNAERTGDKWDFKKNKIQEDVTFYAKYLGEPRVLNVYITYEEGNSKYDKPIKQVKDVRYGDKLELSDIANEENEHTKKRPGYTLSGWFLDKEGTVSWDFEKDRIGGSTGEETNLYGEWSRDEYEIKFETYKGDPSPIPSQKCWYEMKAVRPDPDPKRTHYQFAGWYKEKELKTEWDFDKDLIYGHTTIYAKWTPNIYKLKFETNGGSKLDSIDVEYGTLIPEEKLATKKEGYYVAGWYRDETFTQPFDVTKDFVDKDNLVLYARWELQNYTVKYSITNDVTKEETIEVDPYTYHYGDKLSKPSFEKEHMTLNGWFQDKGYKDKWVFKRDSVKGDTTIYAYWTDTLYKVHFETYGGTEIPDQELVWGSQFEDPGIPERTGYTYTGWYTDGTYSVLWDFEEDFVDGDTTIYAGWSPNSYTVTFDGAGGGPVPDKMTLIYGSLIPKPEDPVREGYTFGGWKPSGGVKSDTAWNFETDTMPEDLTLTAIWTKVEEPKADPQSAQQAASSTGSNTGSGTGTDSGTAQALEQLKAAVSNLAKVMTGDDAPLLWSIVGVMLGAIGVVWIFIKKFK